MTILEPHVWCCPAKKSLENGISKRHLLTNHQKISAIKQNKRWPGPYLISYDSQLMSKDSLPLGSILTAFAQVSTPQPMTLDTFYCSWTPTTQVLISTLCASSHVLALLHRALGCRPDCPRQTLVPHVATATPNKTPTYIPKGKCNCTGYIQNAGVREH